MDNSRRQSPHRVGESGRKLALSERRALNTMPNAFSPSSDSGASLRKRNNSGCSRSSSESSLAEECDRPRSRRSSQSSPQKDRHIHAPLKKETILKCSKSLGRKSMHTSEDYWIHGASVILLLIILLVIFYIIASMDKSACPVIARSEITELSRQFPTQSNRLWAQLRSALNSGCTEATGTTEAILTNPVVLLLVHVRSRNAYSTQSGALFDRFVTCVGHLAAKRFVTGNHSKCFSFPHSVTSEPQLTRSNADATELKLEISQGLSSAYLSGTRCFHFNKVDLLPPETVLLFHGIADAQNSRYKEATLLFSLAHVFEFDDFHGLGDVGHRSVERLVHRYLRSLWERNLGDDAVSALLSRLTPNIGSFYTNQTDEESELPNCEN